MTPPLPWNRVPGGPLALLQLEGVGGAWVLWLVLLAAGSAVLVYTYAGIFRRTERNLTWVLFGLRAAGLLALAAILAKPTWTGETVTVDPGRVAVVLDTSKSMSLADVSGVSRYDLAKKTLDRLTRGLGSARQADKPVPAMQVDVFDIAGEPLAQGVPDQPAAGRTDLTLAVSKATAALRSKPLAAVVVISDGMDNTGRTDFRSPTDARVPIHAVGFPSEGSETDLDLDLREATPPSRPVRVNAEVAVEIKIVKTGTPPTGATVAIRRGKDDVASKKISFPEGPGEQSVSLTIKPTQAGSFVYTATVTADAGEKVLSNNNKYFPLRVDAEPIRVLYLEGYLRDEFKFLKRHLQDDPDVVLDARVRTFNPEVNQKSASRAADPVTAETLKAVDVVLIGNVDKDFLSPSESLAVVKWLDEKGHSLMILGGSQTFGPDGIRATPLNDVVPVVFADAVAQNDDPFTVQLTEVGKRHPIFARVERQAAASPDDPLQETMSLAGASLVKRAKPAAEVLAENPGFVVDGKPSVVLATQRAAGGGHVLVFTGDTTWRWSRLARIQGKPDTLYSKFWSQTIRFLSGRSPEDQRPLLEVSTDRPDYEPGKPVRVTAVRQSRPGLDVSRSELKVQVSTAGGAPVAVAMAANSATPDEFTGQLVPSAGGRYEVNATLVNQGENVANQVSEFIVQGSDLELADTRTNLEPLRAMARSTGGEYRNVQQADELTDKIERKERKTAHETRTEFWDNPLLFVMFLGLIAVEWVVRRLNHMV